MRDGSRVMAMRGATLRRVIQTAADRGRSAATDRDLLRRFADGGDQDAFEALVRRHTGLVLSVCRRALTNAQDAEDACQATFLILARKARAGRWQPSIANWLFATARRVAHDLRRAAGRRARREGRAAVPESVPPVDQMTGRELLTAIDEELDRLPPIYREPLLLYFQAELTRDEIAARLGVPPGTVKIRLERGRKRLGTALTKRGVLLGAGLLALMATSPAGASPPRLVEAIRATVAGQVPPAVATLARGVAVNGVLVRTKWAALAAIGAVVIGLGFAGMSPIAADPPKPVGPSAPNSTAKDDRPNPELKEQTIAGRVLGADGQPVVADLLLNWIEGKPQPLGKTKADGTFRVTVPVRENGGWLLARAPGHGMDFVDLKDGSGVTLRLPKDQPIRGRVIDPQGKPLSGVRVTAASLTCYDGDSLEKHLRRWTREFFAHGIPPGGDRSMWFRSDKPADREGESPVSVKTGADGTFELAGVGAGQLVGLTVRGAGAALTHASVMNRAGFDPKPYLEAADESASTVPGRSGRYSRLFGPGPQVIVEPEKPIRGTVTARDTGKPLAGVPVVVEAGDRLAYPSIYEAVTGADGRYEVRGVPKDRRYTVVCRTDPGTGYFTSYADVEDTAGYEPITVDLACARGVIVTGTVKDRATGKPVSAAVCCEDMSGNPFAKDYAEGDRRGEVFGEGKFRLVTIPGPVLLVARTYKAPGEGPVYRRPKPDPRVPDVLRRFPDASWCRVIEAKPTDRELTVEIELEPAPRMAVKVVDADGKPVIGTHATGIIHIDFDRPTAFPDTDTLTVYNVEPKEERFLAVAHPKRRLVGTQVVKADDKDPVVRLGPGGTATGRLVGGDGKPLPGVTVYLHFARREVAEASEPLNPDNEPATRVGRREAVTDADGRFRFDALFPGHEFRLTFQKGKKRFGPEYPKAPKYSVAKHGDELKLGDVKAEPQAPGQGE